MGMFETIKKEWQAKSAIVFFSLFTFWWIYLQISGGKGKNVQYDLFTVTYGIMALWGGVWGLHIAKKWGGLKSVMGKAIFLLSIGLLAQEFGQLAYTYYIYIKHIEVPYPSWGDVGYFGSIPFYSLGVLYLAKASGVKIGLRSFANKIQAVVLPLIMLLVSDLLFLQAYIFDWTKPLTVFLDFGYPFGDAIYVSLALITYMLSRTVLGGIMKNKILFILFALVVQFTADYTFLFQVSRKVWTISGINDYIYFLAYTVMTLGLLQLHTTLRKLKT